MPEIPFNERVEKAIAAMYCGDCVEPYANPYKRCVSCTGHENKPPKPIELGDVCFQTSKLNDAIRMMNNIKELACVGDSYNEALDSVKSLLMMFKQRREARDG